ncbi:hypothetical protein BD414DRAFT_411938 [Trametes punicea]|nr:hypothetical protein BD414DRAFT_411938 [Trametes punicea]
MFASKLAAAFVVFAAAVSAVSAAPTVFTEPKTEIVYRPHITSPKAGDVWPVGTTQTVTWDTSDIPDDAKNQTGLILLGYLEDGDTDEHLGVDHPLASNFPITAGSVEVTVPDVKPRDDYVAILFGDSGNASPKFTITNSSLPGLSGSASASVPSLPSITVPVSSASVPSILPSVSPSVPVVSSPSVSASAAVAA